MGEISWAPGRITVLGGASGRRGSAALDIAIGSGVRVRAEPDDSARGVRITSTAQPGEILRLARGDVIAPPWRWTDAIIAVIHELSQELAIPAGLHVHVDSELPAGIGLGSRAALTVATARAVAALRGAPATVDEIWRWTRRPSSGGPARPRSGEPAEDDRSDVFAILAGRHGHALRRGRLQSLDPLRPHLVPFDLDRSGHVLLVVDLSPLGEATTSPGRTAIAAADDDAADDDAADDAAADDAAADDAHDEAGAVETVVEAASTALATADLATFGALLTGRTDKALRTEPASPTEPAAQTDQTAGDRQLPSVELAVAVLNDFGALGARPLNGERSVLAVIHDDYVDHACIEVRRAFAAREQPYPDFRIEVTADGALTDPGALPGD